MHKRNKEEELDVHVKLEEPLTSDSCCKLILELVKYLLYQKQQIPVTYEYLLRLGESSTKSTTAKVGASDRCLATARTTLGCLKNISEHLSAELSRGDNIVKEIAVFMGATIFSPKLCVRVSLPLGILSARTHHGNQHPSRKPLLNLMRSMTESEAFQEAMTSPLVPTNTFVLVQKRDSNKLSEYFLPKPRFAFPVIGSTGNRFHIKLGHQDPGASSCTCINGVRIYQDQDSSSSSLFSSSSSLDIQNSERQIGWFEDSTYQWYQSKDVIKGFKFSR